MLCRIGHVERQRPHAPAGALRELARRSRRLRAVARAQQHLVAALGELARHLAPDPAVGARHQRHAPAPAAAAVTLIAHVPRTCLASPRVRVAVVDIGTNSTRLLIADVDPRTEAVEQLVRRSQVTRLGERRRRGRLALAGGDRARVRDARRSTARRSTQHGCEANLAVLTSAVRDAVQRRGLRRAGARASYGARRARAERRRRGPAHVPRRDVGAPRRGASADGEPTVVIDIGGGSTEFIVGRGHSAGFHVSLHAGVVRMSERHIHTDPPAPAELQALARRRARRLPRGPARPRARARQRGDRGRRHRHLRRGDRPGARPLRPRPRARLRAAARQPSNCCSRASPR